MSVQKYSTLLLFAFMIMLSACGRYHPDQLFSKKSPSDNNFDRATPSAQILTQNGANLSPMPPLQNLSSDSSVEVFDMEPIEGYTRGSMPNSSVSVNRNFQQNVLAPQPITDFYGQGRIVGDSSVMIYDLDGQPIERGLDFNRIASAVPYNSDGYQDSVPARSANQIFFKHGSSRLGSGDMRKISNLAEDAKFAPVDYISVEGYASRPTQYGMNATQSHIINLRQSMARSEKVSKALIAKGVPGEKIKTVSWGATRATGNNVYDRRVDVNIDGN